MGGREHASVRKATDRMKDFSVFSISSLGLFLNALNLKMRAGRIFAKKNTLSDAINTFLNFQ